jgi:hypothetical protein
MFENDAYSIGALFKGDNRVLPLNLDTVILCCLDDKTTETSPFYPYHRVSEYLLQSNREVALSESCFLLWNPRPETKLVNRLPRDFVYIESGQQ